MQDSLKIEVTNQGIASRGLTNTGLGRCYSPNYDV